MVNSYLNHLIHYLMITSIRTWFNENFSSEKYQLYLQELNSKHPGAIDFRVAETPVFVNTVFKN
ncbi:hypothetical protein ABTA59_19625, partial [Acinetobacter baumannii]